MREAGGAGDKVGQAGGEKSWGSGGGTGKVQRWSPIVHPLTPSESKGGKKTPQRATNPELGAQMSQEQQNSRAAASQQQGSSTGPCGNGAGAGPPPKSASACPGAQMSPSGERGPLQISLGDINTNHPIFPILQGLASAIPSLCHQCFGNPAWKWAMLSWGWGSAKLRLPKDISLQPLSC